MSEITLEQARAVISAALAGATKAGLTAVAVVVTDPGGRLRAAERTDAAPPFGCDIARAKAATALGFRRSSLQVAAVFVEKPGVVTGLGSALGTFLPLGGGVVVVAGGAVIGAAALAGGAPETDHAVIAAAVAAAGFAALD
jgi:uncharacterized protein GlcG (DUF336 family)